MDFLKLTLVNKFETKLNISKFEMFQFRQLSRFVIHPAKPLHDSLIIGFLYFSNDQLGIALPTISNHPHYAVQILEIKFEWTIDPRTKVKCIDVLYFVDEHEARQYLIKKEYFKIDYNADVLG